MIEAGINEALAPVSLTGRSAALRQRLLDRARSSREAARRLSNVAR